MEGEAEEDKEEEKQVDDVAAATACLARFCTEKRLQRLRDIVGKRTQHATFVFENTANPNNLWACLRSLDAFGIQVCMCVDVICSSHPLSHSYHHNINIHQKK